MIYPVQPVKYVKLSLFVTKPSEEDFNNSNKQALQSWQKKNLKKWANKYIKLEKKWILQPLSEPEWNLNVNFLK